jgi:ATP-dependent Clp protease ATP-binding subunit ClpA
MTDFRDDDAFRRAIQRAMAEARQRGDPWVGSEHLLIALADSPPLSEIGATPERLRASVDKVLGPGVARTPYPVGVPFTAAATSAVRRAKAIGSGDARVTASAILRGLLDGEGHSELVDLVLQGAGVDVSALQRFLV